MGQQHEAAASGEDRRDRPLISADSHVIEPLSVWDGLLPEGFWGGERDTFAARPGAYDPSARCDEMDVDRVSAEVLYPSVAMKLFGLEDAELQARCFRRYNEWLAEYCAVAPDRLVGIGLVPAYDMDVAEREVAWCKDHGMRGVQIWQVPPPSLPFSSPHYEPLWAACSAASLPLSLHILTGFGYAAEVFGLGDQLLAQGVGAFELAITRKLLAVQDAILALVLSGALDRHRDLRLVLVENEVSWLPFFVDQLAYYASRFAGKGPIALERPPAQALADQVYATFFRDPNVSATLACRTGLRLMWSSDYPHGNSTWPNSQAVVAESLADVDAATAAEVTWDNVARLYDLSPAVVGAAGAAQAGASQSGPALAPFSVAGVQLLEEGNTHELLARAPGLWAHVKVYATGGENGVHAHPDEDHLFLVLAGEATFLDAAGQELVVGPYEGMLVPAGAAYSFRSSGSHNLVLVRVGAAARDGLVTPDGPVNETGIPTAVGARIGVNGSPAPGNDPGNKTGAIAGVPLGGRRLEAPSLR